MSAVAATALSKHFGGVRAVDDVSFSVRRGERVALIGPNGAGKSTCFNLLGGQLQPDSGQILIDGRPTAGLPTRSIWRLGVGRTFQITATFASMTVRENVQLVLWSRRGWLYRPWRGTTDLERMAADACLERVGLAGLADRACGTLAYGDLKRVELAVAIANRPQLLLMDEPTAGMAPAERHALMQLVSQLVHDDGISVLFTEHDMDVVFGHADRILVMARGRIVADGSPAAVRADPLVQAVYLGEARDDI